MDARAALDAIYEYVKTKGDAEMMSNFDDDTSDHPKLAQIAKKFEEALRSS